MGYGKRALEKSKSEPPQTPVEVVTGVATRRTAGGIPVTRIHYTAMPERNTAEWKASERKTYTSQADWDREQEIADEAGGGELVFADTLVRFWDKIVITDPLWRPDKRWRVEAGFDHGKTNPTALLRCYIDHVGVRYWCGEYYQAGLEVWEHAPHIKRMADITKLAAAYADPTIFDRVMQQGGTPGKPQERAKSINMLYVDQGVEIFSPFSGDRSDLSFAARVMLHWANLEERDPTLRIVCRNYSERPQPGLHDWDCPNLLWELMRRRKKKSTALQLLTQNPTEALVDKDNHGNDAMKYVEMSWPEPTIKTIQEIAAEAIKPLAESGDLTSAAIRYEMMIQREAGNDRPATIGRRRR